MKTRDPKMTPPKVEPIRDANIITETRKYKLITPLFGGGVKAGEADPITVIRGASVRGQLRFWWRATRGGQFDGDLDAMRKAENAIWGSAAKKDDKASGPSDVTLSVKIVSVGRPFQAKDKNGKPVINIGSQKSIYSYVAFPLRDVPNAQVLEGVEFELVIRYPSDFKKEVKAALWAWETFGGIGARTRRGFGALQLTHINGKPISSPSSGQLQNYIENGLKKHLVSDKPHRGVPSLARDCTVIVAASKRKSAIETWRFLIDKMKRFRQSRFPDKKGRPYGRSKWPEADAIRRLTGNEMSGHEPIHPVKNKFPRAQFGLPIIFKFKESDEKKGDPAQHTLHPKSSERWASPLILRPFACLDGAIGLAIRLSSSLEEIEGDIVLEDKQQYVRKVEWKISDSDANQIKPLNGKKDVVQAFLDYLTK